MDELSMIVCDTCGSVVHPQCLQVHSDWHDSLTTPAEAAVVANPDRTQR